jgi:hypothetical protein
MVFSIAGGLTAVAVAEDTPYACFAVGAALPFVLSRLAEGKPPNNST